MRRSVSKLLLAFAFLCFALSGCTCGRRNPARPGDGGVEIPKTPPSIPEDDTPCWSPDGRFIAYARWDPDTLVKDGIYFIDADGTNQRPLFHGLYLGPDFSPNGTKIAFYVYYGRGGVIMKLDSSVINQIPPPGRIGNLNIYEIWYPRWFLDGEWLAFFGGSNPTPPICKVKCDGSEFQGYLAYYGISDVRFQKSGQRICFVNQFVPAGGSGSYVHRIYVSNPDGSDTTRLNPDSHQYNESPCWSPDGSKIAYTWWDYGNGWYRYGINIMNADGTSSRQLITGGMHPAWSPDGTKIAYKKGAWGDPGITEARIWVINTDGTGDRQLTHK